MQTNRDDQLSSIRPTLPNAEFNDDSSLAEQFQNETLRPILKFQNDILLHIFRQYFEQRKGVFYKLKHNQQKAYIEQAVQKDLRFRSLLTGVIVGHFTELEWEDYLGDEAELRRRMMTMLVKRVQDQMKEL
ncbi:MAG: hypothetical protein R2788_12225 [Saprospiraceae bacterium]